MVNITKNNDLPITLPFIASSGVSGQITWNIDGSYFGIESETYKLRDIPGAVDKTIRSKEKIVFIEINNLQNASETKSKAIEQLGKSSYGIALSGSGDGLHILLPAEIKSAKDLFPIIQSIRKIIMMEMHPAWANLN